MKQNSIFNLWPTFVGEFHNPDHDKIKNGLIEFFNEYKKNDKEGERSSRGENYKLYESSHNLHTSENIYFKSLIQFISQAVLKISNHANRSRIEQFKIKNEEQDIICKSAWFIDYELELGFVLPHTHMDCSWSCVYYVQIGQNADNKNGSTYFFDPARNRELRILVVVTEIFIDKILNQRKARSLFGQIIYCMGRCLTKVKRIEL